MNTNLARHFGVFVLLGLSPFALGQNITSFSNGVLGFETITNAEYQIEWNSDLAETNWRTASPFVAVTATGSTTIVKVPLYYRVRWLNPPPYPISGKIQFIGSSITGLTSSIELSNVLSGQVMSTIPDAGDGSFVFNDLSNGTYHISFATDGYFPYETDIEVVNHAVVQNMQIEAPIVPVSPTNNQVITGSTVCFQWPDSVPYGQVNIQYCPVTNVFVLPNIGFSLGGNSITVSNVAPGRYRWFLQANALKIVNDGHGNFVGAQFPAGHFVDWPEFTVME